MSGGNYNNNRVNRNINNNNNNERKGYRDYNNTRYNNNNMNYQSRNQNNNHNGSRFVSSDNSNNRTYYNNNNTNQNDRYNNSYKKPYNNKNTYNSNYHRNNNTASPNDNYTNYDTTNILQQNNITNPQNYRHHQNNQYNNTKFNRNNFNTFIPTKQVNIIDTLITSAMKESLYADIFDSYLKYYKKLLADGTMKEQEVVEKFELLKKSISYKDNKDNINDNAVSSETKLKEKNLQSKTIATKKCKISKLSYDIAVLHYKNIEDIIVRESKTLDEISLL